MTRFAAGVLVGLLLAGPLPAQASATDCVVRGMVYGTTDAAEVELHVTAPDFCNLRIVRYERHITILSAGWRVEIDIPPTLRGWTRFYYLWGYGVAYLGTERVAVDYGPVEQG